MSHRDVVVLVVWFGVVAGAVGVLIMLALARRELDVDLGRRQVITTGRRRLCRHRWRNLQVNSFGSQITCIRRHCRRCGCVEELRRPRVIA